MARSPIRILARHEYHAHRILATAHRLTAQTSAFSEDNQAPIILAVMSIECFFNDLELICEHEANPEPLRTLVIVLRELEGSRTSAYVKYVLSLRVLTMKAPKKGAVPYQDFALLMQLRNELVHMRPVKVDYLDVGKSSNAKLVRAFESRKLTRSPETPRPSWRDQLLNAEVARWAVDTARSTIRSVVDVLPEGLVKTSTLEWFPDSWDKYDSRKVV